MTATEPFTASSNASDARAEWARDVRMAALLGAIALIAYVLAAGGGRFDYSQTLQAHHVLMADAMLHGRLAIRDAALEHRRAACRRYFEAIVDARHAAGDFTIGESERDAWVAQRAEREARHDWVIIGERWYGYWGPLTPAVFVPLVALFGLNLSDGLALAMIGAMDVALFHAVLAAGNGSGILRSTSAARALVTLVFAFGTSHFWLATGGTVWATTQVLALTPYLLGAWAALAPADRAPHWFAAGLGYGLAALGRSTLWLTGAFFIAILLIRAVRRGWLALLTRGAAFAVPAVLAFACQLGYNAARFGDPRESGLRLQVESAGAPRYQEALREHGLFSLHYVPHNAWYYFAHLGGLVRPQGGWSFDPEGNSVLLMTPPLLYLFRVSRLRGGIGLAALAGALPVVAVLLAFQGTGWVQFGPRYLLDVTPLLLVLVMLGMRGRVTASAFALGMCAMAVQLFGVGRMRLEGSPVLAGLLTPPILAVGVVLAILLRPALVRGAAEEGT